LALDNTADASAKAAVQVELTKAEDAGKRKDRSDYEKHKKAYAGIFEKAIIESEE
jgi:hypothetical protein